MAEFAAISRRTPIEQAGGASPKTGAAIPGSALAAAQRLNTGPKVQALARMGNALQRSPSVRNIAKATATLNGTPGGASVQAKEASTISAGFGNGAVVQGYTINYGNLTNDCGSHMHVYIYGSGDTDLGNGSSPTVKPSWWPTTGTTGDFASKYLVQGHLLNEYLGGPGNTMENLTPITKSANSQHHAKIEKIVKDLVLKQNCVVEYDVVADHSTHPTAANFSNAVALPQTFVNNFPGKLVAEYSVWQDKGKPGAPKWTASRGDAWTIWNEGAHM